MFVFVKPLYTVPLTYVNHTVYIFDMDCKEVKISKVLAINIKELRESKGLTLNDLGEKIGVSRQAIWNLENENSWITLDKIEKICKFFKIEEHELFQLEKSSKKPK